MSKRRNKNKKAGPVKLITPGEPTASGVQDVADEQVFVEGDASEAFASETSGSGETTDGFTADAGDIEVGPAANEPQQPWHQQSEFGDVSAALAETLLDGPVEIAPATPIESIQIHDPQVMANDDIAQADTHAWDAMGVAQPDVPATDGSPISDIEPAADFGSADKRRKPDRKLKLNKLQKHARGEATPEPEAMSVEQASAESALAELAPVDPIPAPEPKPPREPRIAAFAKLTEYQNLSLSHVPGLPEEADVPGHWRGVGFGLGGRRLVSAFDEVVEIMRMPQITHVPGTQSWMLGVANVRGTLLPVVDLKQFLEGERTVMHEGQRVLVVRQGGGNVAVLIDQLFGQRSFNDSQKTTVAADTESRYGHFVKQVYRVGDNDWGVFSMSMLTRTPEFRQAAA